LFCPLRTYHQWKENDFDITKKIKLLDADLKFLECLKDVKKGQNIYELYLAS
jgi:hypothetical protein